ncbi:MAG: FimB/Mfa2 family fimbrial subunit [Bacteroidales bacterium]|nr:FimB/Mfa2 family fimbrial subunit [Bacteroidales bacterium]
MKNKIAIICLAISLLSSCTPGIWEDRSDCPGWFSLDYSQVDPNIEQLHIWFTDNSTGEVLFKDIVPSSAYQTYYEIQLPRTDNLRYYVFGNITSATTITEEPTLNTSIVKKEKLSADSLYYQASDIISTRQEFTYDTVRLHKEFANVDFIMRGTPKKGDDIHIDAYGTTAGLYIDRRYIPGQMTTSVEDKVTAEGNSLFRFRLMRQENIEDLMLKITGTVAGIPVEIEEFPLGEFLKKANYNMLSDDLKDVTVTMDMSFNFINIKIEDWSSTYPVDIEI